MNLRNLGALLPCCLLLSLALPALGEHVPDFSSQDLLAMPAPLPLPKGPVVLTVSGLISHTNEDGRTLFDREMLAAIGTRRLTTTTPWTSDLQQFDVVSLEDLLQAVGATGNLVFASAINDYNSEIPISDATADGAMIAFRHNGRDMHLREKGPLWMIYPYDTNSAYLSDVYMTRSIWQLDHLEIRNTAPSEQLY